jgi:hypothetical protein
MATYKVIQDIEAEDKFVGPLTLKQFIFAAAAVLFGYLSIFALTKQAPFLLIVFVPPMLLGAFLAIPWSKDQSTEIWVLAKIRFYFKPKKRIWNQSGFQELVTVTAPKKIDHQFTNNLSENEVTSRLEALAATIDSRGWAIKNATLADALSSVTSDRLVNPTILPQQVPTLDVRGVPDVMDSEESVIAANFDHMIETSEEMRKSQQLEKMDRIRHGEPLDSIKQPEIRFTPPPAASPVLSADEQQLSAQLRQRSTMGDAATSHLHILPLSGQKSVNTTAASTDDDDDAQKTQASMTATPRPGILDLSRNDDLSVATIARQAKRDQENDNEVVVSLR